MGFYQVSYLLQLSHMIKVCTEIYLCPFVWACQIIERCVLYLLLWDLSLSNLTRKEQVSADFCWTCLTTKSQLTRYHASWVLNV